MKAQIISGTQIAQDLRTSIKQQTQELKTQGIIPGLGVVLVGNNPASISYVTAKEKACEENGLASKEIRLPEDVTQDQLLSVIEQFNQDPEIHGILVQLPLPNHIKEDQVIQAISPEKDVDGFHPISLGKMITGQDTFLPCTPHGVIQILKAIDASPAGRQVTIVGRSNIVGKPLANMLLARGPWGDATVTVCHSKTPDLKEHTLKADILIAAVGAAKLITKDMIKPGAVVIDVGVNRVPDESKKSGFRLVGDVDFDGALEVASAITPVPGGVGPLTITMLLYNTLESAKRIQGQIQ
jgi:methylenetetrahydrofolate dehydrogenase (NADP+)/methenyltetrahydrofolate cyclohydrolase